MALYDGAVAANSTGLAVGVNGVVTERHAGASSRLAVNNGSYATGDAGAVAPGGITIAANHVNGTAGNIRFYGTIMRQGTLTDPQIAQVRTYLGSKSGVTL